jgi:hypothetical protein
MYENVADPGYRTEINGRGDASRLARHTPVSERAQKFADQWRSLSRYSSLAD